jgi:hypothetical protein
MPLSVVGVSLLLDPESSALKVETPSGSPVARPGASQWWRRAADVVERTNVVRTCSASFGFARSTWAKASLGLAFPVVWICGAPADARDVASCGGATTHVVLAEFDGVDRLYLVPLCERHATSIITSTPGSS